jgi:predicted transcriptional regulator
MAKGDLSVTQTTGENLAEELGVSEKDPVNLFTVRQKVKTNNQFVMLFYENFSRLIEILTKTELRVLMCILKYLEFQNVFKLTQKTIASSLETDEANVSRAIKKLREKKIISVDKDGTEYVNPFIFAKGNMLAIKKKIPEYSKFFNGQLELLDDKNKKIISNPF